MYDDAIYIDFIPYYISEQDDVINFILQVYKIHDIDY